MTIFTTERRAEPEAARSADVVGFGAAEVAYAVSLTSGIHRQQAVSLLQLNETFLTDQIAALGASSLLARGQLSLEGDSLVPSGGIRLLSGALQTALRYTEIALFNEDGVEAALYVQAPDVSIFLQPAAMSTWELVVKAPEASDAAMLKQIIDSNVARHPVGVAYFGTETADSAKNHLFVRASENGTWDVADVEIVGDEQRTDGVPTSELLARLAAFVELPAA